MNRRYEAIKSELLTLAEPEYARFASGLLRKPGEKQLTGTAAHVLGVRLPKLRKLAEKLTKENWRENLEALAGRKAGNNFGTGSSAQGTGQSCIREPGQRFPMPCGERYFEEVMLWGFLVGKAKIRNGTEPEAERMERTKTSGADMTAPHSGKKRFVQEEISLEEQFALIEAFVPGIDNWSLCDSFCAGLKFAAKYPEETWGYLQHFLQAEEEYAVRFGVVMLLNYFINETYINKLFNVFDAVGQDGYYVKMAVAWAVSVCYVKFPEKTEAYLEHNGLDDFTYRKALQKIVESRCVSEEVRRRMRERMRRL